VKIRVTTIEEFAKVLIRFGEASTIGGIATMFVKDFPKFVSCIGIICGITLIIIALYFYNIAPEKGNKQ
jgi:hypothetical protein